MKHFEVLFVISKRRITIDMMCLCGAWWLIGIVDAFRSKGRGFESCSSHQVGTLGKSFTLSCLWHFGVKLQHSIRALGSSGLEEAL